MRIPASLSQHLAGSPVRGLAILLLLGLCEIVSADAISERPDPPGTATMVEVDVFLIDIDAVQDVEQRFVVDLFFRTRWQDQRLALPEESRDGSTRTLPLDQIWTPRGLIVNDRGLTRQLPMAATVDDAGQVVYRQRLSGALAASMNFREFPFDVQRLAVDVVSYAYTPDEVRLTAGSGLLGDADSFSGVGWRFNIVGAEAGEFMVPGEDTVRSRIQFVVEAARDSQFYLLTMLLPMSLIVFMAWTVFWLQPDIVAPRTSISTAAIFSLIAFGFSMRLSLPSVSYMTRADIFVLGCTLLVFIALGVAVIGSRWANSERMERALRLNAIARWLYVGLFLTVVAAAMAL